MRSMPSCDEHAAFADVEVDSAGVVAEIVVVCVLVVEDVEDVDAGAGAGAAGAAAAGDIGLAVDRPAL